MAKLYTNLLLTLLIALTLPVRTKATNNFDSKLVPIVLVKGDNCIIFVDNFSINKAPSSTGRKFFVSNTQGKISLFFFFNLDVFRSFYSSHLNIYIFYCNLPKEIQKNPKRAKRNIQEAPV